MIGQPFERLPRCPALRRALSFALALALVLAACGRLIPDPVRGVPVEPPWFALPLRGFLAEGRAEPEAIAVCRPPECGPGLVVGVVRLTGRDAEEAWAVLKSPERLAHSLEAAPRKAGRPAAKAKAARIALGPAQGFTLAIAAGDGGKPPAHGSALGLREGEALQVVLAVGFDARAVEKAARDAALQHLGF